MFSVILVSAIAFFVGYLSGSIPFGLLLTQAFEGKDIRQLGSGNIGATNVFRTGSRGLAFLTLFFDILKGYLPVYLAHAWGYPNLVFVAGAGALLGHIFPVWLRFRGGKGVATGLGVLAALSWQLGVLFAALWLVTFAFFRISSLSALVAVLGVLFWVWWQAFPPAWLFWISAMVLVLFWTHRENIKRLLQKTEPKI